MSALSPLLEHKRTQREHDEISVIDPCATLAGSKYCTAAVCCRVEKCYPRRENAEVMKLARRKFLHLAAGAAALPAVSQ